MERDSNYLHRNRRFNCLNCTDIVLVNVWQHDGIVRIDPETRFVIAAHDLSALYPVRPASADVFNGIACVPNAPE
jgi:glutamine cyclotransferase